MLDLTRVVAARLREAINDLLAKIANGAIPRDEATSMEVARLIDSAEKQIADIERKDEAGREKEREEALRELAVAYKVELEARLNAVEKHQYAAFLKKEHFTKADFDSLEKFYTNSYDKLTDSGKAELSTRVWNGVRRKEYEFIDLPDVVKEKEAARLRDRLSERQLAPDLREIPESDRMEFVNAWDAGKQRDAYEILNRTSFGDNVALSANSVREQNRAVKNQSEALQVLAVEGEPSPEPASKAKPRSAPAELKLDDVMLVSDAGGKIESPLAGSPKGSGREKGG